MTMLAILFLPAALSVVSASAVTPPQTAPPTPAILSTAPFITPIPAGQGYQNALLLPRQQACPASHFACTQYGRDDVCCDNGAYCTVAEDNRIACCASRASCTGTIGEFGSQSGEGQGSNEASTVDNSYYPWQYIPASFSNQGECQVYVTSCQSEYAECTSSLAGGVGGGVTISGPGVQVGASGGLNQASAADVCNSLSSVGCRGISPSGCAVLPPGEAAPTAGVVAGGGDGNGAEIPERKGWLLGIGVVAGLFGGIVV